MDRRDFIKYSAALGTAACLPMPMFSLNSESKYKLGYQLFSIRDKMTEDPVNTLKALKFMGYADFEHYGFDASNLSYYGYKASEFKSILDDLELTISSGHYPFSDFLKKSNDDLKRYVDRAIEGAHAMGSKYIVWPLITEEYRNPMGYKLLVSKLNPISEQITKAGLGFAYHNHGYEFEPYRGETGYDIITKGTDADKVKLQMDMYWLARSSNYTPADLVKKYPKRITMWHIKDMHKDTQDYTELGNGSIDYTTFLPDPKVSGLEFYYIEQGGNYTENSLKSAKSSAEYFKEYLQKLI